MISLDQHRRVNKVTNTERVNEVTNTNTKHSCLITYLSQTTIVQDALSIQGRPPCWEIFLSKMPVRTFLIGGFHVQVVLQRYARK